LVTAVRMVGRIAMSRSITSRIAAWPVATLPSPRT
jgi:hypothetical protein